MKRINESVAFGIVAVVELKDLINNEKNAEKKEVLESVRYAYYYLIKNMNDQFGVTRFNVVDALVDNGYDYCTAVDMVDRYEEWACHVIKVNERGDNT